MAATLDVANDPFFGKVGPDDGGEPAAASTEVRAAHSVSRGAAPTACMSFNYHREHFGHVWSISTTTAKRRTPAASRSASTGWQWRCSPTTASIRRVGRRSPGGRSALSSEPHAARSPRKRFLEVLAAGNPAAPADPASPSDAHKLPNSWSSAAPRRRSVASSTLSVPGGAGPLNARLYRPRGRAGLGRACCTCMAAAWLPATSTRTHHCAVARALRGVPCDSRWPIAWPRNTHFPPHSTMRAPPSRFCACAGDYGIDPARLAHLRRLRRRSARRGGLSGRRARSGTAARPASAALSNSRLQPPLGLPCRIRERLSLDQATLDHDLRHCVPGGADPRPTAVAAARGRPVRRPAHPHPYGGIRPIAR